MKRTYEDIEADLQRAQEEARLASRKADTLLAEIQANEDYKKKEQFKALFKDPALFTALFEGKDAPLNLQAIPLARVTIVVAALQAWRDRAIEEVMRVSGARPPPPRRVEVHREPQMDDDPYDGRPYVSGYKVTYNDGSTEYQMN